MQLAGGVRASVATGVGTTFLSRPLLRFFGAVPPVPGASSARTLLGAGAGAAFAAAAVVFVAGAVALARFRLLHTSASSSPPRRRRPSLLHPPLCLVLGMQLLLIVFVWCRNGSSHGGSRFHFLGADHPLRACIH